MDFHLNRSISILALLIGSCSSQTEPTPVLGNWLIPTEKVVVGAEYDQIPSIDAPQFTTSRLARFMNPEDKVMGFKINDEVKAYPIKILNYHEIVNDVIGDVPVVITYCPLTATGMGFVRQVNGETVEFGVSGLLYNSNLILYDRKTRSLWNQMLRQSVFGEYSGRGLATVDYVEMEWQDWVGLYPDSEVMNFDTGYKFSYNLYPYSGYDSSDEFFLFPIDPFSDTQPSKSIHKGSFSSEIAYLVNENTQFMAAGFQNVQGSDITFIQIPSIKTVILTSGSTVAGRTPSLYALDEPDGVAVMEDDQGNQYSVFGEVVSGPYEGDQLRMKFSFSGYWFAWDIFYPVNVVL